MKNICFFILLTLLCGLFTACDSYDDYIYDTREVFYIDNCQNAVSVRESPSTKANVLAQPKKYTALEQAVPFNDEWHKVTLSSGETGYVLSKYISSEMEEYRVRKKNCKDDLVEYEQAISVFFLDLCEANGDAKMKRSKWVELIAIILVFASVIYLTCKEEAIPSWKIYVFALLPNLLYTYIFFFTSYFTSDIEYTIIMGIFILLFKLLGAISMWGIYWKAITELVGNNSKPKPKLLIKGNLVALVLVMVCAYWIEGWSDYAVILAGIWNVVFLILYLYYIVKNQGGGSRCLILVILTLVCLPPTIVCTILTLRFYFWIICGILIVDAVVGALPGAIEGAFSSGSSGGLSSSSSDEEVKEYTEVSVPGEFGFRRIEHYNDWSGRDQCGDHWEKNWDGTWSKK